MTEYFDLRFDASRGLFKAERKVVAKIRSPLATPATSSLPAAATEEVAHSEEITEDVVEIFEN
jgi:hypothetical protein